MTKLVMLAGVPGSGKSTFARKFFDLKYNIVNPDAIRVREFGSMAAAYQGDAKAKGERVFGIFHRLIRDGLAHGVDTVADATHLTRRGRHEVRALAHDVPGISTHLVLFKNVQQALSRNAARTADLQVPPEAQDRMVDGYYNLIADLDSGERGLYDTVTMIESFS